jgi:mRNA-degrading endonuclease RelE of RelBE toxin-antitoxin system
MAFKITITAEAETHVRALPVRDRRILEAAILARLSQQPTVPTRAIKRLRPNPLAQFELRAGDLRVLYNVEGSQVVLLVVGRKIGDKLVVKGQEFYGHQDHPTQRPRSRPPGHAQ